MATILAIYCAWMIAGFLAAVGAGVVTISAASQDQWPFVLMWSAPASFCCILLVSRSCVPNLNRADHAFRNTITVTKGLVLASAVLLYAAATWTLRSDWPPSRVTISPVNAVAVVLVLGGLSPLAEELFFRSWLWRDLRAQANECVAFSVSNAMWWSAHLFDRSAKDLILLAVFGMILGTIRLWSGNIMPCIALHTINNVSFVGISIFYNITGKHT